VTQQTVAPAAVAFTGGQYAAIRANLIGRMLTTITRLWLGLGSWHKSDVARFQRDALPVLAGTQRALGQLVAVYVSQQATAALGTPVAPPVVPSGILTGVRKGVTLEDEYARPFEQVWWHLSQGVDLPTAVDRGQDRLGSLLDLDTQVTEAVAAQAAMEATDATWWRRVPQGEKTCLLCLVASTQRYHVGELKAVHPGCVPAGQVVSGGGIVAATRRRYAGKLAILATTTGDEVAVTPNHPVLTEHGWVAADLVRPGDHLVRGGRLQGAVSCSPHESQGPALVEDVWRSLSVTFGFTQVPLAAEDFHGDGADGYVDVVRPDGDLAAIRHSGFLEGVHEGLLVPGRHGWIEHPAVRHQAALMPAMHAALSGGVSGGGLSGSLLRGQLGCPHEPGFGGSASWDARLSEPASYDGSRDPEAVSDDVLGKAVVDVVPVELLDRVVDVRRVSFSGHVFNLQTRSGWYESSNHIVHNCDCEIQAQYTPKPADRVIDDQLLLDAYAAVKAQTGRVITSGEVLRTLLADMTDYHSELGPILVTPRGSKAERAAVTPKTPKE
jgi:hypothetical protein